MKSFIYKRTEGRSSRTSGGTPYTIYIYRIVKGSPVHIVTSTDCFCSEFQQVLEVLQKTKALPKKAFEPHQFGGFKYGSAWQLREAGIVNINRI